jgi:hypothetical protein
VALVVAAAAIGAVAAYSLKPFGSPDPALATIESRLVEIGERLDRSERERARLAAEIQRLEVLADRPAELEPPLEAEPVAAAPEPEAPSRAGETRSFDGELLVAAGFAGSEVSRYQSRVDDIELRRLYVRDQAVREGWIDTPRYRVERQALSDELRGSRAEFGEDFYDGALYTTGHPNRVSVTGVIEGSAAADAGVESGDLLVRYADQRVLSPNELRDLTTAGSAGELTEVHVLRGNEELRLFVPRGPLGVQLEPVLREPPPLR